MRTDSFWLHRLRWRLRAAAWLWPAFGAAVLVDGAILHFLPPVGPDQQINAPTSLNLVGDVVLASFTNLFLIAVITPWLARRLAARPHLETQPAPPYEVLLGRTAAILMGVAALGLVVVGLGNRPVIVSETQATEAAARTLRSYVNEHGSPEMQRYVGAGIANTVRLASNFFRSCVPVPSETKVTCFFIDTKADPPTIRRDPDTRPNRVAVGE